MSGLGLTKMYELLRTGRVRSILLDGKRLVDLDSIENLDVVATIPPAPGSVAMRRGGPGRPRRSRGQSGDAVGAVAAHVPMAAAGSDVR
jgi:hypothetical protein